MFEITRHEPSRAIRDLLGFIGQDAFPFGATRPEEGTLAVDVSEVDGAVVVRASLPGFDREDVDIQVHQGVLTIKAEHTEESETSNERFYHKERRIGSMSRRIALPGIVSEANATAKLEDGVLTVRIPQTEDARPKQVAIK